MVFYQPKSEGSLSPAFETETCLSTPSPDNRTNIHIHEPKSSNSPKQKDLPRVSPQNDVLPDYPTKDCNSGDDILPDSPREYDMLPDSPQTPPKNMESVEISLEKYLSSSSTYPRAIRSDYICFVEFALATTKVTLLSIKLKDLG